jgi:hypothetical protein
LNGIQEVGGSIPPGSTKSSRRHSAENSRLRAAFCLAVGRTARATKKARVAPGLFNGGKADFQ